MFTVCNMLRAIDETVTRFVTARVSCTRQPYRIITGARTGACRKRSIPQNDAAIVPARQLHILTRMERNRVGNATGFASSVVLPVDECQHLQTAQDRKRTRIELGLPGWLRASHPGSIPTSNGSKSVP